MKLTNSNTITVLLMSLLLGLSVGCTRKLSKVQPPKPTDKKVEDPGHVDGPHQKDKGKTSQLTIGLPEAGMQARFKMDTSNLTYKFVYLAAKQEGPIKFENGMATLVFEDLKAGEKGLLTLDVYAANVHKLHGEIADLVLGAGNNEEKLDLKLVNSNDDTTLTIGVVLDNGDANQPPPPSGGDIVPPGSDDGGLNPPGVDDDLNPPGVDDDLNPPGVDDDLDPPGVDDDLDPPAVDDDDNPATGDNTDLDINIVLDNGDGPNVDGDVSNDETADQSVDAILKEHCTECHHTGTGLDFTKYPYKSRYGSQKQLMDKVLQMVGDSGSMPPEPRTKLNQAQINAIKSWMNQGLPTP